MPYEPKKWHKLRYELTPHFILLWKRARCGTFFYVALVFSVALFSSVLVIVAQRQTPKSCSQVAFQLIPPTSWAEQEKICKRKWKEQTWTLNLYHMLKVIEALLKCKLNGVISVIRFARSSSSHSVPQNIQHPLLSHFHSALRVTLKCQCSSCGSKGRVKQNVSF